MAKIKLSSNQIKAISGGVKKFAFIKFKGLWHLCRCENEHTEILFSNKNRELAFLGSILWMEEIVDLGGLDAIEIIEEK